MNMIVMTTTIESERAILFFIYTSKWKSQQALGRGLDSDHILRVFPRDIKVKKHPALFLSTKRTLLRHPVGSCLKYRPEAVSLDAAYGLVLLIGRDSFRMSRPLFRSMM